MVEGSADALPPAESFRSLASIAGSIDDIAQSLQSAKEAATTDRLTQCANRPTLLIAGETDPFATAEQMLTMKREIPSAEWLILNNAGHTVHFELPEIVGPRILDFLRRNT